MWDFGDGEWLKVLRVPEREPRRSEHVPVFQHPLAL
jgi:hypothetical protein